MKKPLLCSLVLSCLLLIGGQQLSGQDFSRKFGKITNYEVDMQLYEPDTSAVAVYLYESSDVWFAISTSNIDESPFRLFRDYAVKIKILKPGGLDLANVEIPFRSVAEANESVSQFSVSAYNRVNGKIVETKLKNSDILTEQYSENMSLRKFTIPEVRVGTVIEYKYRTVSNYFFNVPPIKIQHAYPVVYSYARVATPEYFSFNVNSQGYHRISIKTSREPHPGGGFNDDVRTMEAENVPALKNEPYVWSVDDFRTDVNFELRSIAIPGVYYKDYTTSWTAINKLLADSPFGEQLKGGTPLRDEVDAIKASSSGDIATARAILKLVIGRMNWNGRYSLLARNPRQRLNEGSGSSADINTILGGALRYAGFEVTPVLLNPREAGRLPYAHPSIDNIETYVLMVTMPDGSRVVVDGTNPGNDINVIHPSLMVDRAWIYGAAEKDGWADLSNMAGEQNVTMLCRMEEDRTISGTMIHRIKNSASYTVKSKWSQAASEDEYVEKLESENAMKISSFSIEGLDGPEVTEKVEFTMQAKGAGEYLYIDATVVPFMTHNRFSQQKRLLPVEFPYPEKCVVMAVVSIPEGYTVEQLPENTRMNACDDGVEYTFLAGISGSNIQLRMTCNVNRVVFTVEEYEDLNTFFGMVAEKNNAQIILKKI
ncbi:MAG: DUF3857 domain-containing protein [Alistipes sp.]|jgi:hypothetical protein|nr:DUF3857 domain-containing protein [Alistipes sp.]